MTTILFILGIIAAYCLGAILTAWTLRYNSLAHRLYKWATGYHYVYACPRLDEEIFGENLNGHIVFFLWMAILPFELIFVSYFVLAKLSNIASRHKITKKLLILLA